MRFSRRRQPLTFDAAFLPFRPQEPDEFPDHVEGQREQFIRDGLRPVTGSGFMGHLLSRRGIQVDAQRPVHALVEHKLVKRLEAAALAGLDFDRVPPE